VRLFAGLVASLWRIKENRVQHLMGELYAFCRILANACNFIECLEMNKALFHVVSVVEE
jgi:hypothetical protein